MTDDPKNITAIWNELSLSAEPMRFPVSNSGEFTPLMLRLTQDHKVSHFKLKADGSIEADWPALQAAYERFMLDDKDTATILAAALWLAREDGKRQAM